jgi:hypothetical protein
MVWRLFATKLETAETMECLVLNIHAPYFYPTNLILKETGLLGSRKIAKEVIMSKHFRSWLGMMLMAAVVAVLASTAIGYCSSPLSSGKSPGGGSQEGIKVHGHWTEVRNPDGTLVKRREFENSLMTGAGFGNDMLTRILARKNSVGRWGGWLVFHDASGSLVGDYEIIEASWPEQNTDPRLTANLTVNRPDTGATAGKLVLSGTTTAQQELILTRVYAAVRSLDANLPPSSSFEGSLVIFTAGITSWR